MISAQDKILYVANKLGLTSLKDMQASTGAVYDVDTDISGQIFSSATRHQSPSVTNVNENQFEVNEALLVETIAFYAFNTATKETINLQTAFASEAVVVFDLVIGNKTVIKSTPVFTAGTPYTFASAGLNTGGDSRIIPRHQVYMEGAGVLIPPQVQWSVNYRVFDLVTGDIILPTDESAIGCYLFGTRVLLNFNTSI